MQNDLAVENCSIEDHFDKCIVFQAFSKRFNRTVFKRECASERFCAQESVCSDLDYKDCKFECCTGDLCNNFGFKSTQPTEAETTMEKGKMKKEKIPGTRAPFPGKIT